jgi:hypothetical protein
VFYVDDKYHMLEDFDPDIYIIALQEMVPLNAMNVMKKDHKRIEQWRALLVEALDIVNT